MQTYRIYSVLRVAVFCMATSFFVPLLAEETATYQVSYENIDEKGYANQCGTVYSCPSGTVFAVTKGTPVRNGYNFLGWYSAPEGGTKYNAGQSLTINANTTIYAHWQLVTSDIESLPSTRYPLPQKSIMNGHLYIIYNHETFDITGQRVR